MLKAKAVSFLRLSNMYKVTEKISTNTPTSIQRLQSNGLKLCVLVVRGGAGGGGGGGGVGLEGGKKKNNRQGGNAHFFTKVEMTKERV